MQFAKPRERMTGVRGRVVVVDAAAAVSLDGGKGRFAAHRMSMLPMHSDGPCLHSTSEDLLDTLDRTAHKSVTRSSALSSLDRTHLAIKDNVKSTFSLIRSIAGTISCCRQSCASGHLLMM